MNLKEAFPKFIYLHALQPRLDKAGDTVEDFIEKLKKPNNNGKQIPPEVSKQGTDVVIFYLESMGWPYILELITALYP